MVKGLARKVTDFGVLGIITTGILYGLFGGPKYDVDGSTVKKGYTRFNSIVENKEDGDKIRYSINLEGEVYDVFINGMKHNSKDTLVYEEARIRYDYLNEKIDSIKNVNKELKAKKRLERQNKRLAKRKEMEEKDLWVIRK